MAHHDTASRHGIPPHRIVHSIGRDEARQHHTTPHHAIPHHITPHMRDHVATQPHTRSKTQHHDMAPLRDKCDAVRWMWHVISSRLNVMCNGCSGGGESCCLCVIPRSGTQRCLCGLILCHVRWCIVFASSYAVYSVLCVVWRGGMLSCLIPWGYFGLLLMLCAWQTRRSTT